MQNVQVVQVPLKLADLHTRILMFITVTPFLKTRICYRFVIGEYRPVLKHPLLLQISCH